MSIRFILNATSEEVFDPITISGGPGGAGPIIIDIENTSSGLLSGLGIYLRPSTSVGDIERPISTPETNWQEVLNWGTATDNGTALAGGLKITHNPIGPPVTEYFTHSSGASRRNKIVLADIPVNGSISITLEMETPPSVSSSRFLFVDFEVD